jgi:hypothetical protein
MRTIVLALLLTGCASATPIYDRQGQQAVLIECGKFLAGCYRKAEETCRGPYTLLDEGGESGFYGYANKDAAIAGSTRRNQIKVRCGR